MAIQFILGRSGSGKTTHCIRSIAGALTEENSDTSLVLLVPEQATYQAERAICADERIGGYSRLHILSFDRLRFILMGQGGRASVSRLGRQMIVHKLIRANTGRLKVFGTAAKTTGLAQKLTATIIELHECAKSADDVMALAETLKQNAPTSLTTLKFADIAFIFQRYLEFLEDAGNNFINPDIQLTRALKKVRQVDFLNNAILWVDGFAGFTIQQQQLLVELLKAASRSHIALCLDPAVIDVHRPDYEKLDPAGLFYLTERTYTDMVDIVKKCKLQIDEPVILDKPLRFAASGALAYLESNLFDTKPHAATVEPNGEITIVRAPDSRSEVTYVARKIIELVKDKGLRYRDIAVIASDISAYQHYVESAFADFRIPLFIDKPTSLGSHPVVELIVSALAAASGDFSMSDCFAYLKTGFTTLGTDEVDMLENYCLTFGVDGGDFCAEHNWNFAQEDDNRFDEKEIDRLRRSAIKPLVELRNNLIDIATQVQKPITAAEFVYAIFNLIEDLQVRNKLAAWTEEEAGPANSEHIQFYNELVDIFDELTLIFGAETMEVDDYTDILKNIFEKMTLKQIPPRLEEVLVGSIERSRHPDLKAVFLLGATQKQFPAPIVFDSILTDDDRQTAHQQEFFLSDRLTDQLGARQYLAYIAFTRPSDRLYITYPLADDAGRAVAPSQFLNNVKSLFASEIETCAVVADNTATCIRSTAQLADLLCQKLTSDADSEQAEVFSVLNEALCKDGDEALSATGRLVKNALDYDNKPVFDAKVIADPSFQPPDFSATRLATFAACPYKYFAKYILELRRRELLSFEPVDMGNFYHQILDMLFKELKKENLDFVTANDCRIGEVLNEQIETLLKSDSTFSNFLNHRAHNRHIIYSAVDMLKDCVKDLAQMSAAGSFRQAASEIKFGKSDTVDSRYELALAGNRSVTLRGIIDRVDLAEINGARVAVIFDYKRKGKNVSWSKFYHGLDIQLALYMLAADKLEIDGRKIDSIAGVFYLPVEAPVSDGTIAGIKSSEGKFNRKAKGIFNGDFATYLDSCGETGWSKYYNFYTAKDGLPYGNFNGSGALRGEQFARLFEFAKSVIGQLAEQILTGRIDISPFRLNKTSPCSLCDYRSLCRFDWQINRYNLLSSMNKSQVLDTIGQSDAD